MTTGATIHTSEGLKMAVACRDRHPIIPKTKIVSDSQFTSFDQSQADQQASEDDQTSEVAAKC
jgi:hypothetical protein